MCLEHPYMQNYIHINWNILKTLLKCKSIDVPELMSQLIRYKKKKTRSWLRTLENYVVPTTPIVSLQTILHHQFISSCSSWRYLLNAQRKLLYTVTAEILLEKEEFVEGHLTLDNRKRVYTQDIVSDWFDDLITGLLRFELPALDCRRAHLLIILLYTRQKSSSFNPSK